MPSFRYDSLSVDGQKRSGMLDAMDRADVVRQLLDRGETATRVVSIDASASGATRNGSTGRHGSAAASADVGALVRARLRSFVQSPSVRVSPTTMATLVRELATALEAGLPLMQALRTIRRQATGKGLLLMLDHLIARVEAGDPLWTAARDFGQPFDDMIIGMLRAADASGDMSVVLHQLADLLDRSIELRRDVMGATFYPLIVFGLLIASIVVLVTVVVPRVITPMAADFNASLPAPTAILLSIADFLQAWWPLMVALAGLCFIGWIVWSSIPANRVRFDRFLLRVPALGRLLRDVAVARFTRTLGTLAASGLPILDALRITRNTLGNRALEQAIDDVVEQVTGGRPLAEPLEKSGLFPPLLVQVVGLGERSGRLDSMLLHAAGAFDRQVRISLGLLTKALPPFLLVLMSLLGGFVLLAILLPLIEIQSMVN